MCPLILDEGGLLQIKPIFKFLIKELNEGDIHKRRNTEKIKIQIAQIRFELKKFSNKRNSFPIYKSRKKSLSSFEI